VVVDGYHFDATYQRELKAAGLQVLIVDDDGRCDHYAADLVLNQNVHANESMYSNREPYTRLLLGLRYILLRREFQQWRKWKRDFPVLGRKILITMGGSDPDDITSRAIDALMQARIQGLEAVVVIGGGYSHSESLQKLAAQNGPSIRLLKDPANMPELMAWADLAMIAAGGTLWELMSMGCPVLSYVRNPVQAQIISLLEDEGVVQGLGYLRDCSPMRAAAALEELANSLERRKRFSELARASLDGQGAERVLDLMVARGVGQL